MNPPVRRWGVLLFAVIAVSALNPIAADDFWWQLSRGRSVVRGSWTPSRDRLIAETGPEADWMGGVPIYLLYAWSGVFGVMVARLLAAAIAGWWLFRSDGGRSRTLGFVLTCLGLLAAGAAWDPVPLLFDSWGVVFVWVAAERWRTRPTIARLSVVMALLWMWANVAPLCLLGLLVVVGVMFIERGPRKHPTDWKQNASALLPLIAACCLTPRGPATLWDSLRMLVPRLTTDSAVLATTRWRPLAAALGEPETIAFIALSMLTLVLMVIGRATWREIALFFVVQTVAWSSEANMAPAALWTVFLGNRALRTVEQPVVQPLSRWRLLARIARSSVAIGLMVWVGVVAMGYWPSHTARLGWGLDPHLQSEQFETSLAGIRLTGSAHCVGVREAGLLSWFKPDGIQPYDTPSRALLGGRLRAHILLNHELETGWRAQHRREDGNWGGWWLPLTRRRTNLLIVPAERVALIRALEPTRWKPLSVDAPSLAYGIAGERECSPRIVEVLKLQQFLDRGSWSYTPPPSAGTAEYLDIRGRLTGRHNLRIDVRQARVLRAMRLHVAALRVLNVALKDGDNADARREFARNQLELGYQERLTMGRGSVFRTWAYLTAARKPSSTPLIRDVLRIPPDETAVSGDSLQESIDSYVSGDLSGAIDQLSNGDAESLYAKALLTLEAGQPKSAVELLQRLIAEFPDLRLSSAGRNVLQSLPY